MSSFETPGVVPVLSSAAERAGSGDAALDLIGRVREWADHRDDVRTVLLLGSRVTAGLSRAAADVDLVVIVDDLAPFLGNAWLEPLGQVLVTYWEARRPEALTRHAVFNPLLAVEFAMLPGHSAWAGLRAGRYAHGPVRVLYADAALDVPTLGEREASPDERLTEVRFRYLVNSFWYQALVATLRLDNGEIWTAHRILTRTLHPRLETLVTATAPPGARESDPGRRCRRVEQWAEPEVRQLLHCAIAVPGADVESSVAATACAFDALARRCAATLGFAYPVGDHATILQRIAGVPPRRPPGSPRA